LIGPSTVDIQFNLIESNVVVDGIRVESDAEDDIFMRRKESCGWNYCEELLAEGSVPFKLSSNIT
jgi:hypothetical protein